MADKLGRRRVIAMVASSLTGTLVAEVGTAPQEGRERVGKKQIWRAVHILAPNPDGLPLLKRAIEEQLAPMGVNVLVFEVNYKFAYRSDPDLRMEPALSYDDARSLAQLCRQLKIRLIPEFNCLGHQSWAKPLSRCCSNTASLTKLPTSPLTTPEFTAEVGVHCTRRSTKSFLR